MEQRRHTGDPIILKTVTGETRMAKGSVSFFIQQHLEHLEPFRFELFSYFTTSSVYHILYSVRHVVNANGLLIDSLALKTFCFQPLQVSTPPAAHLHFCRQMMKNLIFVVTFVSIKRFCSFDRNRISWDKFFLVSICDFL